jgi:hypothetical protein
MARILLIVDSVAGVDMEGGSGGGNVTCGLRAGEAPCW